MKKCNDEIFTFFGTQSRSENSISGYGTAALSLAGNGACAGTAVQTLPKDSASAFLDDSTITVLRRESNSFSLILSEKRKSLPYFCPSAGKNCSGSAFFQLGGVYFAVLHIVGSILQIGLHLCFTHLLDDFCRHADGHGTVRDDFT